MRSFEGFFSTLLFVGGSTELLAGAFSSWRVLEKEPVEAVLVDTSDSLASYWFVEASVATVVILC